jgi:hypothetical protein
MEKIDLCNAELESSLFENVKYFMITEGGAMGTPGEITVLTAENKYYRMNYLYGDIDLNKLGAVFPVFKQCDFGMFGATSGVPDDWKYVYLGAGHHLLVEKSIFNDFAAIVGDVDNSGGYDWFHAAVETLVKRRQFIMKGKNKRDYENKKYLKNDDNTVRYVLGKYNREPLIVFGINPSQATDEENDRTISIVENHIVEKYNKARGTEKDGYVMLNIYPMRATKLKKDFPEVEDEALVAQNLKNISEWIKPGDEIIAAWGTHICDRKYFLKSLVRINEVIKAKSAKWICLKETKAGHPHHPIRLAIDEMKFAPFDMDEYIEKIKR